MLDPVEFAPCIASTKGALEIKEFDERNRTTAKSIGGYARSDFHVADGFDLRAWRSPRRRLRTLIESPQQSAASNYHNESTADFGNVLGARAE